MRRSIASAMLTPTGREQETIMNRLNAPVIIALALIFGFILLREDAATQTMAKDLVGTWTIVSVTPEQDGKKADFWNPIRNANRATLAHVLVRMIVEP
jgi:hypothetical protein